jgi:3'-phosphoadenosine 5'-phosphosulfate sulfotransferase (PAPS reductase)/FAD synthetase
MTEPRLTRADVDAWNCLRRTAQIHAGTHGFARHLESARRVVGQALETAAPWCLMWSGGKDSTVMAHMVCVEMGQRMPVASEKDDLDYPGEREYVEGLARAWGLDLHVLEPPISPREWLAAHAGALEADGDLHSRAAGLSKACFYEVVERFSSSFAGVFLGLRAAESRGRNVNRAAHGLLYSKARSPSPLWVATPLGDWTGLDVYAYAETRAVELLPVYRCIALAHRTEPWQVRKSWWVPGAHARLGGLGWLRHYYPSLYRQYVSWLPLGQGLT